VARCTEEQGKFGAIHAALFQSAGQANDNLSRQLASKAHVDRPRFERCMSAPARLVNPELTGQLRLAGTPTFLIAKLDSTGIYRVVDRIEGVMPLEQFTHALDRALAGAEAPPMTPLPTKSGRVPNP